MTTLPPELRTQIIAVLFPDLQGTKVYVPKLNGPLKHLDFEDELLEQLRIRDNHIRQLAAKIRQNRPDITIRHLIIELRNEYADAARLSETRIRDILKEE